MNREVSRTRHRLGCRFAATLLLGSVAIGIQVSGCSVDDLCEAKLVSCPLGTGGNGGTGGDGGTGGIVPPRPECDPEIAEEGVDDGCGVFVSKSANGGDGTRGKPLNSINEAIDLARTNGTKRVYLCATDEDEPFDEAVTVPAGVTVYGGLNCSANWELGNTSKTYLTAPQGEVPLRLNAAEGSVRILDLHVTAKPIIININDPQDAEKKYGQSSIAAIADAGSGESGNGRVELVRCTLKAEAAAPGAPGEPFDANSRRAAKGRDGSAGNEACTAASVPANESPINDCGTPEDPSDDSVGGPGGTGFSGQSGPGAAGSPGEAENDNGGTRTSTGVCGDGLVGENGANGVPVEGTIGRDTISRAGYSGSPGKDGNPGSPGQGGGGGAGGKNMGACATTSLGGASGGSGGTGGCGGKGGKGGGPGGSSIALVSIHAKLSFQTVQLIASSGGAGGEGAAGQLGGFGGGSGPGGAGPTMLSTGCAGGEGGIGGNGGAGAKGSDGHSLGIAYLGPPPPDESQGVVTIETQGIDRTKDFGGS